jgi:hypothetical protein
MYYDALEITDDFREDYEQNLDYLALVIQLMMLNEKFVDAHKLINHQMLKKKPDEMERLVRFKNEVHHMELVAEKKRAEHQARIFQEVMKMPERPASEQFALTAMSKELSEEEFIAVAKILLINPDVQVLAKSWFLQELSDIGVPDEVQFLWMNGETRSVKPDEIGQPDESESFVAVKHLLAEKLANDDPILLDNLKQEVTLQFAVLYPFSDEVVVDPVVWAAAIIDTYSEMQEDVCDKVLEQAKNDQAKIQQILAQIYF